MKLARSIFDLTAVFGYLLSGFVLSAWTFVWFLRSALPDWHGGGSGTWPSWLMLVPLAYVAWLLWFLAFSAVEFHVLKLVLRYEKRPRECSGDGLRCYIRFYGSIFLYLKMRLVYSLPFVPALVTIPIVRHLVFRSYAATDRVRHGSLILGVIFDPDLTEVAADAVIGSGAVIVAHAMTTNADGSRVLVTAPITIGPRAVIGGNSKVVLGCVIGADAIVEAMSFVPAWTTIGPGEVWGGNPAVFQRHRPGFSGDATTRGPSARMADLSPDSVTNDAAIDNARRALALAFGIPVQTITNKFTCDDCPDQWDSLGQMAIAAAVHSLTGIEIPADRRFQLFSLDDIAVCLRTARSGNSLAVAASDSAPTSVARANDSPRAELLPLEDHAATTRRLAERAAEGRLPAARHSLKVIFAGTFVTDPLNSSLRLWCRAFGIEVEVASAGFDQIPQALLSPDSPLRTNAAGLNVILVRTEDLADASDSAARRESILNSVRSFAEDFPGLLIVGNLPPVAATSAERDRLAVEKLRGDWVRELSNIRGVQILDVAGIVETVGIARAASAPADQRNGIPYSAEVFNELGIAIARLARERRIPPTKVLALDADGVLWGGVAAEDGPSGILLGEPDGLAFQEFQQAALELKQRGVLLAIVSRNEPDDVQRIFEQHPAMVLRSDDIAAWRVNWNPKSVNLQEIAAELNIALDSVVFIDDDEANRLEVLSAAPDVLVPPLADHPAERTRMLRQLWCFDAAGRTLDDANRTPMILAEAERRKLRTGATEIADYLKSLELRVRMRAATSEDHERVAQLTQKTNQFNLSLRRRSESEIAALSSHGRVHVIQAVDRFGDYGMIGVCITTGDDVDPESLTLDTLLLSCRALGRGIEDAVLAGLARFAQAQGRSQLIAPFVNGPRNQPARDFLQRRGFQDHGDGRHVLPLGPAIEAPAHIAFTFD